MLQIKRKAKERRWIEKSKRREIMKETSTVVNVTEQVSKKKAVRLEDSSV